MPATATALICRCGLPLEQVGRLMVCAHCDRPCKKKSCARCDKQLHTAA